MAKLTPVRRRANTPRNGIYDQLLREDGYDPEEVEYLDDEQLEAYLAEDWSKLESAGMGASESIGAGLGGAAATFIAGAALTKTGIGAPLGIPLMIGAGLAGAFGGNAAQDKIEEAVYKPEDLEALEARRQEARLANPLSSFGGQMAPSLLSFRPSLTQLRTAGSGIGQAVKGSALGVGEKQALLQSGIGAATEAGFEGVQQVARGEFDPSRLALAATVGTALQKPTYRPKNIDSLIARGRERAEAAGRDPNKVFNMWAEPLPSTAQLRQDISDTLRINLFEDGKHYTGDTGTKVGVLEDRLTPTSVDLVSVIDEQVTRGVGVLDPLKVGPAAESMRRPGLGAGRMTAEEAARGYGVAPEVLKDIYGAASVAKKEAQTNFDKAEKDLDAARKAIAASKETYTPKRQADKLRAGLNRAQKNYDRTSKALTTTKIPKDEKTKLMGWFGGRAKQVDMVDPATGKLTKRKVIDIDPEVSRRLVDRDGEPLTDKLEVWEPTGLSSGRIVDPQTGITTEILGLRATEDGQLKEAFEINGELVWRTVSKAKAKAIRRKFENHLVGVRKNAQREIDIIEAERASRVDALGRIESKTVKKPKPLDTEIVEQLAQLAAIRGFNISEAIRKGLYRVVDGKLQRQAGFAAYDTRQVTIDPRVATDDTLAHEGFHNFIDDLQYSTNKKDRKLREDVLKLFADEETAVQFFGEAMTQRLKTRRANANQGKFKNLLREAKLRWQEKFGIRMSPKALKDYLLIKYDTDQPFIYNSDLVDGFAAKRLGKKPTDAEGLRQWRGRQQKIMDDVQAGNPIGANAVAGSIIRSNDLSGDPWKDLKFQRAKSRYDEADPDAIAPKEVAVRNLRDIRRSVSGEDKPKGDTAPLKNMLNKGIQDSEGKFQPATEGERAVTKESSLFAKSSHDAKRLAEAFDKFGTPLAAFDPERSVISGGTREFEGVRKYIDPRSWVQLIRYAAAETDQLILRPFKGLKNEDITDATKSMALYARDAHNRLELAEKRYSNMFIEPILLKLKKLNLSKSELATLGNYRAFRRLVKKYGSDKSRSWMVKYNEAYTKAYGEVLTNRRLFDANTELDKLYRETRAEQAANGPKIKRGKKYVSVKEATDDYYDPYMLSHDNTTILRRKPHTPEGKALQDKIIKFWMEQRSAEVGPTPDLERELRDELAEYIAIISNKDSYVTTTGENKSLTSASKFGALRKSEGLLMPPDLIETDPFMRAQRYVGRFSKDMAWFTQIEGDHVMRAVRDLPNDEGIYTHRPSKDETETKTQSLQEIFGEDVDVDYINRAQGTFKRLDETHSGFHRDADLFMLRLNRAVTSQWLGALSGVRDTVNSFKNANIYMRTQDWPLVLKSLTNLEDAWKQSHISGANRSSPISQIEFAHDSVDRAADALSTVANLSQKYSGRELFERGTRAIQFNLGKLMMRSYTNNSKPDAHINRVLDTVGRMADINVNKFKKDSTFPTEDELNKLATAWVEINQGTYGVRGVPTDMIRGKSSWFLSLSRWSVEKFNRYMKDVILPMKTQKDFKPFVKATLGSAVEGALLVEIANMMNAKESYEPTTRELIAADADFEEYVYHAMHLANLSGYFGVLSGLSNDAVRTFRTGKAGVEDVSMVTFPALEALLTDKGIAQTTASYLMSGNVGDGKTTLRFAEDIITNLNQSLRIARNQLISSSNVATEVDRLLDTTYFKSRADEVKRSKLRRDLTVFNRLHKNEHTAGWFSNLDRYSTVPTTQFQHATNVEDMQDSMQAFMENAWSRSKTRDVYTGKEIIDEKRFVSLLQEGVNKPKKITPLTANDPLSIRETRKFADFIGQVKGQDAVRNIINQEETDILNSAIREQLLKDNLENFIASKM